jgi:copper(I)-binding protein
VLSGIGAVAVLGVGLLWWTTSRPLPPPNLGVSAVYTPPGDGASAQVDFTVTNTGAGPDTLLSAGTEFQTAAAAKGVLVCATPSCAQPATVTIPAHSTMIFGAGGPDVVVSGLGPLASGHQPLQLTLTFARSGVVHVLSPVGSATDLTENDVMTYGYMGHAEPGMGMDDDMPGMTGMPGPSASRTPQPMPGMTTPGGH